MSISSCESYKLNEKDERTTVKCLSHEAYKIKEHKNYIINSRNLVIKVILDEVVHSIYKEAALLKIFC